MQELQFAYFRGMEAEQYSFYRVPKVLFTAECFKSLSCEAKVLYGLMLDRMSLSIKNRWFDDEDRVYIIFTVEEIMELMNCKTQKATKLLKELDTEEGIGLIEKKRLGLGKPNVIYVKNFMIKEISQEPEKGNTDETQVQDAAGSGDSCAVSQNFENQNSRVSEIKNQEFPESKIQNFENQKSGISEIENPEFPESQFKNFENQNTGILKITSPEFPKSKSNKTNIIKTDYNETDNIPSYPISRHTQEVEGKVDVMEQMDNYRELIRERIFYYECYGNEQSHERENVDELVELIVEVMLQPDNSTVRIAGMDKPAVVVKSRFMKLEKSHIEYVLFCLRRNTTKVGKIKAYLLTTLYNATMTISNYYQAEVNHDMYGGG